MTSVPNNLVHGVPYGTRGTRFEEPRPCVGPKEKNQPPVGTRFECVLCAAEVPPSDLLCLACYEKRRPPVCPSCGGRLAGGKCGWC